MDEKQRLFVDMDGTLAVFRKVDELETLYEKGYFLNLAPQKNVLAAVRELMLCRKKTSGLINSFRRSNVITEFLSPVERIKRKESGAAFGEMTSFWMIIPKT